MAVNTNSLKKRTTAALYRDRQGNELFVPTEILLFCHTLSKAVSGQSRRKLVQALNRKYRVKVSENTVGFHVKKFGDRGWIEEWTYRGADPPNGITVARLSEVRAARKSWHYTGILARLNITFATYVKWLRCFPAVRLAEWAEWLYWLYGGPMPKGWYAIPERILRLRKRLSIDGIANAAGLNIGTVRGWLYDEKWAAVQEAVESARHGHTPRADSPAWSRLFTGGDFGQAAWMVEPKKQQLEQNILAYAQRATMRAALRDCGMRDGDWFTHQQLAEQKAGPDARTAFVDFITNGSGGNLKSGVVGPGLFCPTTKMKQFCEAAKKSGRMNRAKSRLPSTCLNLWFLHWTVPKTIRDQLGLQDDGTVVTFRQKTDENSNQTETFPQPAIEPQPVKKTTPTKSAVVRATKPEKKTSSPIPLTELQREVIEALDGKAMIADDLEHELSVSRHTLFKALNPLKNSGRIKNDRKIGGYYRPDAPPGV